MKMKTRIGRAVSTLSNTLAPDRWTDIDTLRSQAKATGIFDDSELKDELIEFAISEVIRRAMRQKDSEGYPLFPSISIPKANGKKSKRLYMSERRMKVLHYTSFAAECKNKSDYWKHLAIATFERCNTRYQTNLLHPWFEDRMGRAG